MSEPITNTTLNSWSKIYLGLTQGFPQEAYSTDSSRGFDLTSIKAQYVVERLNTIVGVGNWRHEGTYEKLENHEEILFMGKIIINSSEGAAMQFATGSAKIRKNLGDAYKGAKTDSLSKVASLFGLGNEVFKGNVAPPSVTTKSSTVSKLKASSDVAF